MSLAPGTRLGIYEIKAPIGAGGMGEVYRATDTKLGREVAVKILPGEMAKDPDRLARFHREARAVAALNHPNVVTLYSVEECDGVHFLTMELVQGVSLDRRIAGGGLPVEQIIGIAGALAEALAAAHEKGIVHRDLKPANVMVTDQGLVKVLDFGLAKAVGAESSTDATLTSAGRTEVGIVMGTPAYMSPEQVSGRTLDHRTDIFSLGVVLHEMATGRRPFEGISSAELVSSILRDSPPLVTDLRTDLPSDLARVIRRCLEKDPRHRVQTARDVSNEFRDLARQTSQSVAVAKTLPSAAVHRADSGETRADEGFWVAVLPFKYGGGNADLTALADGLTEDIVTGLSRFSYLRVIARSSTARYASESGDVRGIGKELGARFVIEGSMRQAGSRLRLAVQLVDATTGAHLWAETYERVFSAEAVFDLQDELVPRIVSTVAESHGVLPHSMSETLRGKNPAELTPYEALMRGFAYFQRVNAQEHAAVSAALERAVEQVPTNADCWAMLSMLRREGYTHGFDIRADALDRSLAAAKRAVELAPSNNLAYHALGSALFFRREIHAFRSAAQKAISLNPMDGFTICYMGFLIAYSGDWEHGCELVERARNLNPHHPGWYWFPLCFDAYHKGDYRGALDFALKVNMPGFWRDSLALAVCYGQLGELEPARNKVRELLAARPDFAAKAREECAKWWQPELVESLLEGLRKAGLEIPREAGIAGRAQDTARAATKVESGAARAAVREDEGFWVALLPFKSANASAEVKALADGLSEEIVAGLSRFSYLRVITQGSTQRSRDQSSDLRTVGKELGARYVMTGNLRQVGARLRVAAQLVDATTGAQLWSETYERPFSAEAAFELQDDLVPRIVATVGDAHGILSYNMSESLRSKTPEQLTPYEAVLRSFGFGYRFTAEEHAVICAGLERAVQQAPDDADAWAMLSIVVGEEYTTGFNLRPDPLGRALEAARRAVDAAPANANAQNALARILFYRKEFPAFRTAAEQSLALNPFNGPTLAGLGRMIAYAGDWDRGCALVERALELNPRHPPWYWFPLWCNAYRQRDYRGALNFALKINLPGYFALHESLAAAYGQLGERDEAAKALRDLLALKPDYAETGRERLGKWLNADLVEHVWEGMLKAGLEVPEKAKATTGSQISSVNSPSGETRAD